MINPASTPSVCRKRTGPRNSTDPPALQGLATFFQQHGSSEWPGDLADVLDTRYPLWQLTRIDARIPAPFGAAEGGGGMPPFTGIQKKSRVGNKLYTLYRMHPKAADPLHAARVAEMTLLWRLAVQAAG